jgi:uncharacterized protein YjdB
MKSYKAGIVLAVTLVMAAAVFMSCSSNDGKLASITVTPIDPVSVNGTPATYQFTATGTFSDGMALNYTSEVIWSSSTPSVATISMTPGSAGQVTVLSAGTTTITAIEPYNNLSSSSVLTIATSMTITIDPPVLSMATGTSHQFTATGLYLLSDATITQSLMSSPSLTWSSSNTGIALVSQGLVTAVSPGGVDIIATDLISSVTGTANVTVN